MKKYFAFILVILIMASCHEKYQKLNKDEYTFDLKVKAFDSARVYLAQYYKGEHIIIDSVFSDKGNIHFVFPASYPSGEYRLYFDPEHFLDFIFAREDIEMQTHFFNPMDSMSVISSQENKIFFEYLEKEQNYRFRINLLKPLTDNYPSSSFRKKSIEEYRSIIKQRDKFFIETLKKYPDLYISKVLGLEYQAFPDPGTRLSERGIYKKEHFFDLANMEDSSLHRTQALNRKIISFLSLFENAGLDEREQTLEYISGVEQLINRTRNEASINEYVINFMLDGFEAMGEYGVLAHIADNHLPEETCKEGLETETWEQRLQAYSLVSPGNPAPDLLEQEINYEEKEFTLLIFWASWCPHCRNLLPGLQSINSLKSDKIEVISISLDEHLNEWKAFLEENPNDFRNICSGKGWNDAITVKYNIYATPSMFIIDREGIIVNRPRNIEKLIAFFKGKYI